MKPDATENASGFFLLHNEQDKGISNAESECRITKVIQARSVGIVICMKDHILIKDGALVCRKAALPEYYCCLVSAFNVNDTTPGLYDNGFSRVKLNSLIFCPTADHF